MEKAKYNGNALDILKSKRYLSVISGVIVAGLVTLVPAFEPYREQLYGLIALVFGGLAMNYSIEDWINAALGVISGDPLPSPQGDIFKDIENKNENNPPVTLPDTPVAPFAAFKDTFGDKHSPKSYKWTDEGNHPHAPIQIPFGYDYTFEPYTDEEGNLFPHKALNTKPEYGTRLNIAWLAGMYTFTRDAVVLFSTGDHLLTLDFEADVKSKNGEPFYNWIAVHALVNGERVPSLGRVAVSHINPSNGRNTFQWLYQSDEVHTGKVSFQIQVHNAYAQANSVIDIKSFDGDKKKTTQ